MREDIVWKKHDQQSGIFSVYTYYYMMMHHIASDLIIRQAYGFKIPYMHIYLIHLNP